MAASAERGPEIGLGALRNRGGRCGYVHRRARSGHVRGFNSATLESQFVDPSAEFARRRRSADDPRGKDSPAISRTRDRQIASAKLLDGAGAPCRIAFGSLHGTARNCGAVDGARADHASCGVGGGPAALGRANFAFSTIAAVWGPGLLVMLADTDAGNVVTAAQAGSVWGFRLAPVPLLLIPVLILVQDLAVRIGIYRNCGFGDLIRENLGVQAPVSPPRP